MTAALKPVDSSRRRTSRKAPTGSTPSKVTPITQARPLQDVKAVADREALPKTNTLKVLPHSPQKPVWLQSLQSLQRTSSIVALVLLGTALSFYGSTVYSQQRWSEEYQKLETLRRSERQLSAAGEALKHQIAATAENPETGLVPQHPENMIFLQPAPERPAPQTAMSGQKTTAGSSTDRVRQGY